MLRPKGAVQATGTAGGYDLLEDGVLRGRFLVGKTVLQKKRRFVFPLRFLLLYLF